MKQQRTRSTRAMSVGRVHRLHLLPRWKLAVLLVAIVTTQVGSRGGCEEDASRTPLGAPTVPQVYGELPHIPQLRTSLKTYGKEVEGVRQLLEELSASDLPEGFRAMEKAYAISVLGVYRDAAACSYLVEEINFTNPLQMVSERGTLSAYPAAEALAAIGEPAVRALVERMKRPLTKHEHRLVSLIVQRVYQDADLAAMRLNYEVEKATTQVHKENLQACLTELRSDQK